MKPDIQRILGWAIPALCMVIAGWVFVSGNQEFLTASDARLRAQRDNIQAAKELQALQGLAAESRYAAVDDSPEEETDFLTYLRNRALSDDVVLKNWSSQSIIYGKDKLTAPLDDTTADLLKGIRKISGALTLSGSYSSIRKLVSELEWSDRLYTLSQLTWTTTREGTQLAMTISRYVAPPKPTLPGAKPEKPGAAPSGPGTATKPGTTDVHSGTPGSTGTPDPAQPKATGSQPSTQPPTQTAPRRKITLTP